MTTVLRAGAMLFDMDGVLVDSNAVVDRILRRWAERRDLDPDAVAAMPHGRKTRDTVAAAAPHLNVAEEVAWLDAQEMLDLDGIVAVRGARELLASLPDGRWGVVTSSGRELAHLRLAAAGLPVPRMLVSGESVTRGKPEPEGYLVGAARLGRRPAECIVVEDAPAGIAAGTAAGMRVVGVATTYAQARLTGCAAVVADLTTVSAELQADALSLTLRAAD